MENTIVVTGASRGIGKAIAESFLFKGTHHVIAVTRNDLQASRLLEEWSKFNSECLLEIKACDFSDEKSVRELCSDLSDQKNIEILINNAGVFSSGTLDSSYQDVINMTKVNFFSPFLLTQTISKIMQKNKRGYIFNIISNTARRAFPGIGAYSASKHALLGLSESLRLELLSSNVSVTNINPSFVNTDMTSDFPDIADTDKIQTDDIVKCVDFLLTLSPGAIIPNMDIECSKHY
ncbi:hypothetical protein BS333_03350 [Vibrio azureus]|uniref:3-oxoacyl-[acyl-carrier-protein] reductase n=1 Tax=Vibrio azureus NBRC 104587 TaxID=1219077 RepID=U3ANQ7_9VIBR|nr:SDR family oxidoreductase [Vibrio azureus]AUI85495.1 hypothetical protein BS333_03350 [Vibrio azureus]GAD75410.1 3-oxoacyl-[acyl-carrier-protein] reductase [Vibrio azureus NBRC 104587]